MNILKRIIGGCAVFFLCMFGIGGILAFIDDRSTSDRILYAIFLLIIFGAAYLIYKKTFCNSHAKEKSIVSNKVKSVAQPDLSVTLKHVNGLPVPENTFCQIYSRPDKYEISVNGTTFNIAKAKVIDVSIKTESEIQQHYVSSIGGAVGGAVLFGPLGAIIGGRAKKKTSKKTTNYLIFTYLSDNEIKYVGFEVGDNYIPVSKFLAEFKPNATNNNIEIDL